MGAEWCKVTWQLSLVGTQSGYLSGRISFTFSFFFLSSDSGLFSSIRIYLSFSACEQVKRCRTISTCSMGQNVRMLNTLYSYPWLKTAPSTTTFCTLTTSSCIVGSNREILCFHDHLFLGQPPYLSICSIISLKSCSSISPSLSAINICLIQRLWALNPLCRSRLYLSTS